MPKTTPSHNNYARSLKDNLKSANKLKSQTKIPVRRLSLVAQTTL